MKGVHFSQPKNSRLLIFSDDDTIACTDFGGERLLHQGVTNEWRCSLTSMLIYFFTVSAILWWVMLTVAWCLSTGFQWSPEGIMEMSRKSIFHLILLLGWIAACQLGALLAWVHIWVLLSC